MAQFKQWFAQDFTEKIEIRHCESVMFTGDDQGTVVGVRLYKDGAAYSSGGTVTGAVKRSDGGLVALTGTLSGNAASVVIPAAALACPGPIGVRVTLTQGGSVTTVLKAIYSVDDNTGAAVDPGTIIPSINDLITAINTAVASIPSDYSALLHTLSPDFSASTAYAAGDYVWYNGTLYRFTADHAAGSWTGTDATAAVIGNDLSNLKSDISIENVAEGIYPAEGGSGTYADSTISVVKTRNIVSISGEYTTSARRRIKVSGDFAHSTSSIPNTWYADEIISLPGEKVYGIEAIEMGGSVAFPAGNTNYAMNYQVLDTAGTLVMSAYRYIDGWRTSDINSDAVSIGAVILTINKNYIFTDYKLSFRIAEQKMGGVGFVDTASGDDKKNGSRTTPLKTIGKAISLGYRKICAKPGTYNEKITLTGGKFALIPWVDDQDYSSSTAPYRPKIKLIKGTKLTVAASGTTGIYQASFTAASGTNIYKVFVNHTIAPTTSGSLSIEYNALLIGDMPNTSTVNKAFSPYRQRLFTPVLTEGELSAEGTFFYDGTNHLIKFHPWNDSADGEYYIPDDDADNIISLQNMESVHMEDVKAIGCYSNCIYINKCDDVTLNACEAGYSGKGMGIKLDYANARVSDCHAYAVSVDGFNLHGYGYSEIVGCSAFYCGDDGISHHQGCSGFIDGGEWAYNGSGGITPSFGSQIDVRNANAHHNKIGIQWLGFADQSRYAKMCNCLSVDNITDVYVKWYVVEAWNNIFRTKDSQYNSARSALIEYGTVTPN